MKKRILLFVWCIAMMCTAQTFAKETGSGNCGCTTSSIFFSTGYNRISNTVLPAGSYDNDWTLIGKPSSATITLPSIPYVITPYPVWGMSTPAAEATMISLGGWLSPFNTSAYTVNNPAPDSFFYFQFTFCVCTQGQYQFSGLGNADDYADMILDGNTSSPIAVFNNWATVFNINTTVSLAAGTHTLWLRLRNLGGVVMGVCAEGTITQVGGAGGLIGYDCCNNGGSVLVRKFADVNCDNVIEIGTDTTMRGWTFTLNPGGYVGTTDALGNLSFTGVPAGTYTLTETVQPGWSPILPTTTGSTTVVVNVGSTTEVDVLNSQCHNGKDSCALQCYWRVTGNSAINPAINFLGTTNPEPIIVKTNNTQRAVVEGTGDGNIGIATTAPSTILHVFAAPPPGGAPSGVRFEKLPVGAGNILVVDPNGYVYMAQQVAQKALTPGSDEASQLQSQIADLQSQIAALNTLLSGVSGSGSSLSVSPNPTSGVATVTYQIAGSFSSAEIRITDNNGNILMSNPVTGSNGNVTLNLPPGLSSSQLLFTLLSDNKVVATQKVVLLNK